MADLFQNPSNQYIDPGLAPCAGGSDTFAFEFFPKKEVGIISGAEIIQSIDLSDISIPVTGWIEEKKTLVSGEVIYVPGLEKGLLNRTQAYYIPAGAWQPTGTTVDVKYFYSVDISINYYYNFRYYDINIEASSNYGENIDIDNAISTAFAAANITASCTYDPSYFSFVGNTAGWDYDVTNIVLNVIDQRDSSTSPFQAVMIDGEYSARTYDLVEDTDSELPSAKYPNGAMLGYVIKPVYPSTAGANDRWVYTNNVESPFIIYETTSLSAIDNASLYESLDYDASLVWPKLIDASIDTTELRDVSIGDVSIGVWNADASTLYGDSSIYNMIVDASSIVNSYIFDSSIIDSSISNSFVRNTDVSSALPVTIQDSSIILSYIKGNVTITSSRIQDSSIIDVSTNFGNVISGTTFKNVDIDVSGGNISNSLLKGNNKSFLMGDPLNYITVSDSSIQTYSVKYTNFNDSIISDSSLFLCDVSLSIIGDASLFQVNIWDSSIVNCYVLDSSLNHVFVDSSDGTYISRSTVINSAVSNVILNNDTSVWDSSIYNSWTNMYGIYDQWVADLGSTIVFIHNSEIMDTSINNTWIYDSSIWVSDVEDSSLIRCTIYNSVIDSNTTITNCRNITVNASWDASILSNTTTNTYYQRKSKKIDVGRSGAGTSTILSAAEYLDYINTENRWNKVGPFAAQISADDPDTSSVKNLIGGFYVFNPHEFSVQVEYMLINYV